MIDIFLQSTHVGMGYHVNKFLQRTLFLWLVFINICIYIILLIFGSEPSSGYVHYRLLMLCVLLLLSKIEPLWLC